MTDDSLFAHEEDAPPDPQYEDTLSTLGVVENVEEEEEVEALPTDSRKSSLRSVGRRRSSMAGSRRTSITDRQISIMDKVHLEGRSDWTYSVLY